MDNVDIRAEKSTKELEQRIFDGFHEHALKAVGEDYQLESIAFSAYQNCDWLGSVVAKTFWGALHIKYLFVAEKARGRGVGQALMEQAMERGRELGCRFAFVETMSFQAVDFYKKLGFAEDFVRHGYDCGTSFHYLSRSVGSALGRGPNFAPRR